MYKKFPLTVLTMLAIALAASRKTSMPNAVPPQLTPLSRSQAKTVFFDAFREVFGREPTVFEASVLLAQSEHETAAWSKMWNHNWGGIKGSGDGGTTLLKTREGFGPGEVTIRDYFAAYTSSAAGCVDWLRRFEPGRRYEKALGFTTVGNPRRFVETIHSKGYFTGDPNAYATSVAAKFELWLKKLEVNA